MNFNYIKWGSFKKWKKRKTGFHHHRRVQHSNRNLHVVGGWVGGVRGGHRSPTLSGSRHTALSKLFSSPEPEATDDQFNAIGFKLGVCVRVVACVLWHEPRLPARGDLELSRD